MSFVGDIVGAWIGADANRHAVNVQTDSADRATQLQRDMYDQTRADQAPYRDTGYSALDRLSVLLGLSGNASSAGFGDLTKTFTGADLQNDPGYQFRLQQGTDNLENSRAASGGLFSGAAGKALTEYGQGFASQEFGDAYNRFNNDQSNLFNRLSGLSGTGQTANQQVAAAGQNYANQAGQNMIGAGNARASGYLAQGNLIGGAFNKGIAAWQRQPTQQPYDGYMPAPFSGSGEGYGIGSDDGFYTDPYNGY